MTSETIMKLARQSSKSETEVEQVLIEVRAEALRRFKNKNSQYKDYVVRATKLRLGMVTQNAFKGN